jgi:hypothetical protein
MSEGERESKLPMSQPGNCSDPGVALLFDRKSSRSESSPHILIVHDQLRINNNLRLAFSLGFWLFVGQN